MTDNQFLDVVMQAIENDILANKWDRLRVMLHAFMKIDESILSEYVPDEDWAQYD